MRSPDGTSTENVEVPAAHLAAGLQYGSIAGYEPFVEWIEGFQAYAHRRHKGEGWRVSVGSGSQDLLYKVDSTHEAFLSHNNEDSYEFDRHSMHWSIPETACLLNLLYTREFFQKKAKVVSNIL